MMLFIRNAQPIPVSGWYTDRGGHRLFLRLGDLAPICPQHGMPTTVWQLVQKIGGAVPRAGD